MGGDGARTFWFTAKTDFRERLKKTIDWYLSVKIKKQVADGRGKEQGLRIADFGWAIDR
jgi:hypothetical protein